MDYICLQPCNMGGKNYITGDTIPSDAVLPARAKELEGIGLIAPAIRDSLATLENVEQGAYDDMMYVTLLENGDNDTAIPMKTDDVALVIIALQKNATDAVEFVKDNIDSTEGLTLLQRLDQRKTVQKVIAEKLRANETVGDE